jgi:hypothetical protein
MAKKKNEMKAEEILINLYVMTSEFTHTET